MMKGERSVSWEGPGDEGTSTPRKEFEEEDYFLPFPDFCF